MAEKLTQSVLMNVLDWTYERALEGIPGFDSAEELANSHPAGDGSRIEQVDSLIRWQVAKAGTSGFITGLGGLLTLPVAVPANLTSVWYIQLRMIAAIAHMAGYDIRDDRVRTLAYICLASSSATAIMKEITTAIGTKLTMQALKSLSGKTITAINRKVGFRLLTKFGSKGVINLAKWVPLVSGVVGLGYDAVTTNTIGNVARDTFIGKP